MFHFGYFMIFPHVSPKSWKNSTAFLRELHHLDPLSARRNAGVGAAPAVAQRPDGGLFRLRGRVAARGGAEDGAATHRGRQQFERQGPQ